MNQDSKVEKLEALKSLWRLTQICNYFHWNLLLDSFSFNKLYNHSFTYYYLEYTVVAVKSQQLYPVGTFFSCPSVSGCSIGRGKLGRLLVVLWSFLHEWVLFWWARFFCYASVLYLGVLYLKLIDHFSFLGPNIWLEYGQYSVGGIGQKGGLEKVRSVFERALSSVGLHMTKGLAIWEAYREFESAIVEAARVSDPVLWPVLPQE